MLAMDKSAVVALLTPAYAKANGCPATLGVQGLACDTCLLHHNNLQVSSAHATLESTMKRMTTSCCGASFICRNHKGLGLGLCNPKTLPSLGVRCRRACCTAAHRRPPPRAWRCARVSSAACPGWPGPWTRPAARRPPNAACAWTTAPRASPAAQTPSRPRRPATLAACDAHGRL